MSVATVVAEHVRSFDDPIVIRRGDDVAVGKRDDRWPQWLWRTADSGKH